MTVTITRALWFGVAVATALTACQRSPESSDAPGRSSSVNVPVAAATVSSALEQHISTRRYRIDVTYPPLSPEADVLARALHARTEAARVDFMKGLPDPKTLPEFADRQLRMMIDYKVASRTPAFVSVREQGMMDTGGAHPIPLDGTFVFDLPHRRLVAFDDLFVDPVAARARLSVLARKALYAKLLDKVPGGDKTPAKVRKQWQDNMRGMIDDGTRPTAQNFGEFLVDGGGLDAPPSLVLVFSPYQVAPYVYGAQTVKVPLKDFASMLKPPYRGAFGLAP
ncbi:RsiV family protein [Oleiagrimonas sp. MCCC 1A03011]|uniref:RsiV family protein n=1 Tax=Oleiagrimonas sp. MCCC 1A03011 TaxID=1926883 RepID=UPI000DC2918C|nr:RsiV family protein [Oleiagrimonas sp. MCCC 1A03011]RAP57412.1 hypothetical protein BTJ49_10070 [Oleiagrimonas sp. MCCC 1A03011]